MEVVYCYSMSPVQDYKQSLFIHPQMALSLLQCTPSHWAQRLVDTHTFRKVSPSFSSILGLEGSGASNLIVVSVLLALTHHQNAVLPSAVSPKESTHLYIWNYKCLLSVFVFLFEDCWCQYFFVEIEYPFVVALPLSVQVWHPSSSVDQWAGGLLWFPQL